MKLMLSQACAGLFLDPGLGKTSISLGAFSVLRGAGYVKRMLIIAPLRVCYNVWPKELRKWNEFAGLTCHILHDKGKIDNPPKADIYIINPDGLEWLAQFGRLDTLGVDMLVVDESTQFKRSNTKRFKLIKTLLRKFKRRYILTGTPAPNGLMDLFGQIYILDEGNSLGRYISHYRNNYFYPGGYGGYEWTPQKDADKRIAARIANLVLRMSADEYLQLPELVNVQIPIVLPPAARRVYDTMEAALIASIESDTVIAANAAVASGKCRQIADGAIYANERRDDTEFSLVHDEKMNALKSLVEELSGQPLLVLYEFNFDRIRIKEMFPEAVIIGQMSAEEEEAVIDKFNEGKISLLVGNPQSMRFGLNLQGACAHVCWFTQTWNLEFYDQGTRRVWRQGQKSQRVFVYHLIAQDTVDEVVVETLSGKDRTQGALFENLKRLRTR